MTTLIDFTFPDSGETIQIKRLRPHDSAHVLDAARASRERPQPPHINNPDAGVVDEPDYQDRGYLLRLREYDAAVSKSYNEMLMRLIARRCVFEIDHERLAELRQEMAAIGAPFPDDDDDHETYLYHVLAETPEDVKALVEYATGQSRPSEEAIRRNVESFRGHVS